MPSQEKKSHPQLIYVMIVILLGKESISKKYVTFCLFFLSKSYFHKHILLFNLFYFMSFACCVSMCTTCLPGSLKGKKKGFYHLEL